MTRDQLAFRATVWLMVAMGIVAAAVHYGHPLWLSLAGLCVRWAVARIMTPPMPAGSIGDDAPHEYRAAGMDPQGAPICWCGRLRSARVHGEYFGAER
jgi:hypothetical protein